MKLLIIGGLLTVGIIVVGSLTISFMQNKGAEQTENAQSTSDVASLQNNQSQSGAGAQKVNNDLVVQGTPVNTSHSNVSDEAIVRMSLPANTDQMDTAAQQKAINDLVIQDTLVNTSNSNGSDKVIIDESLHRNKDLSGTLAQKAIKDLVVQDTPINMSNSNGSDDAILDGSLYANKGQSDTAAQQKTNIDLVVQDTPVSSSNSSITDDAIIDGALFGNKDQSGTRVHQAINDLVLQGTPVKAAILNVINNAIANEGANLLSSAALNTTRNHKPTALAFMANMVAANDLFPATKLSIENKPEDVLNIINVGVVLYPDFAQEVINAAVITGEIDPNEALLAAIAAGADPTTVSQATAAGGVVNGVGQPFDGLFGGGAGDEDPSASIN
jgi:hypothetical protein